MEKRKSAAFTSTLLAGAVFLSGCASIVSKSRYPVSLNSTPQGARVSIVNSKGETVFNGTTPATATLKAKSGYFRPGKYTMTMEKEGYAEKTVPLNATLDGWYIGNVIFGGLIGILIVDPATGAMWRLDGSVDVPLEMNHSASAGEGHQLMIVEIDDVPLEWRTGMVSLK